MPAHSPAACARASSDARRCAPLVFVQVAKGAAKGARTKGEAARGAARVSRSVARSGNQRERQRITETSLLMIPRNIGELLPIERAAEAGGAGTHSRDAYAPGGGSRQRRSAACSGDRQRAAGGDLEACCGRAGDRIGFAGG